MIRHTPWMNIDAVVMTHFNLIVQGENDEKTIYIYFSINTTVS
jgi:hypothetical protein